jgi:hypothetical protein
MFAYTDIKKYLYLSSYIYTWFTLIYMIISNKFCSSITPLRNHLPISKEYSDSPMALGETG